MTTAPWEPASTLHRRGWLAVIIALGVCVLAFIYSGTGDDPRNALPWGWTATGWVVPARSLAFVWLFAALLFAILSRVAWRLQTDWPPPPRGVRWSHAIALLLVTLFVYITIAICWTPLPIDPALLTAGTLAPGGLARLPGLLAGLLTVGLLCAALIQQNRSIWWAALIALHPLMLWQCASNGSHFCIAALLVVMFALSVRRLPATVQKLAPLLPALLAGIAVALTARLDPFNSPTTLLPFSIPVLARVLTELLLQSLLLLLATRRHWPVSRTLGHTLLLAILMMPAVPPGIVLLPLALIPFAWNRTTWALSLAILLAATAIPTLRATGHLHVPLILATLQWIPVLVLLLQDLALEALALLQPTPALAPALDPAR